MTDAFLLTASIKLRMLPAIPWLVSVDINSHTKAGVHATTPFLFILPLYYVPSIRRSYCVHFLLCWSERREKLHGAERFTGKRTGQAQICSLKASFSRAQTKQAARSTSFTPPLLLNPVPSAADLPV